ncbi:MAG: hypothetical protein KC910_01775 [Candidatus Eremiobacteraeota bacterium]|nr:hypothetical protein [Candidatus Eremiobacteraeota bacterium]
MGRRGFNLIEVAFAVALIALTMILLIGLMLTAHNGSASNHEAAVAASLAETHLDELKRGDFNSLVGLIGVGEVVTVDADGRPHTLTTQIERLGSTPGTPDYQVLNLTCVVTWESRSVDPESKQRQARFQLQTQAAAVARY